MILTECPIAPLKRPTVKCWLQDEGVPGLNLAMTHL